MRNRFDLRYKRSIGETYLLVANGGYMVYTAIYRFNGSKWKRELAHHNCQFSDGFKSLMTSKEFKKIFDVCDVTSIGHLTLN